MGTSENNQNQNLTYSAAKNLEPSISMHSDPARSTAPLAPVQPTDGSIVLNTDGAPPLKCKHAKMQVLLSPCRTSGGILEVQVPPLEFPRSTLNFHATSSNAVHLLTSAATVPVAQDASHAPSESPHEFPPIAILPEIVSPVLPTRINDASIPVSATPFTFRFGMENPQFSLPLSIPQSVPQNTGQSHAERASSSHVSTPTRRTVTKVSSASFPRASKALQHNSPVASARRTHASAPAPEARARDSATASTRRSPDDPDLHLRAHASLHRPLRAGRIHDVQERERYARGSARELDAFQELTPAPIGVLRGPPRLGVEGAAVWVERLRASSNQDDGATQMEGDSVSTRVCDASKPRPAGQWWSYGQPNTAPTAAYAALLEDAFGPGSVLRGEGPNPAVKTVHGEKRKRKRTTKAGGRSASEATTVSVPEATMDVDVEGDTGAATNAEVEVEDGAVSRAAAWIAEIQILVKGKRQMARKDLKSLADTLRTIANMSVAEGRALGDDGLRLKKSLQELTQLGDIPFGDEHGVHDWAIRLLRYWPE
ncbi:Cyclin-domain-containing protein [Mycena venus]|uniref:Cyclin-domain-containing protein n=1 Tax=Mycena venus TaxID=2733690 RepID=A0A8H7D4V5_9AGAR|nr:Cyclin-domain-containing protein [Mycena venus]